MAEKWLIALDKCFSMQDIDSNVKLRWDIEERKLGVRMNIVTWDLFPENFHECFLLEK